MGSIFFIDLKWDGYRGEVRTLNPTERARLKQLRYVNPSAISLPEIRLSGSNMLWPVVRRGYEIIAVKLAWKINACELHVCSLLVCKYRIAHWRAVSTVILKIFQLILSTTLKYQSTNIEVPYSSTKGILYINVLQRIAPKICCEPFDRSNLFRKYCVPYTICNQRQ